MGIEPIQPPWQGDILTIKSKARGGHVENRTHVSSLRARRSSTELSAQNWPAERNFTPRLLGFQESRWKPIVR